MSSSRIDKQAKALRARRETLSSEVEDAAKVLEATRTRLVGGKATVEEVTHAQSTYTALFEALGGVDGELTSLDSQLEAMRADEAREAKKHRAAELREQQKNLQAEFDAQRTQANEVLSKTAARMVEIGKEFARAARELRELQPGPLSVERGLVSQPLQFGQPISAAMQVLLNEENRLRLKESSRNSTKRASA